MVFRLGRHISAVVKLGHEFLERAVIEKARTRPGPARSRRFVRARSGRGDGPSVVRVRNERADRGRGRGGGVDDEGWEAILSVSPAGLGTIASGARSGSSTPRSRGGEGPPVVPEGETGDHRRGG